jgi:transcriptional regulator with XRE-family HTH domain
MVTNGIPIAEPEISYTAAMPTFTVEQVIAARAFLGWSQHELGGASGLPFEAVRDFERAKQTAAVSIKAIRNAFHGAGVDFLRHGDRVGVTIVMPWQEG